MDLAKDIEDYNEFLAGDDDIQRTDEWFKKRKGKFTGSKIKNLMNCSQKTSKLKWGKKKLFDFGSTAERYVYSVGKERLTGCSSQKLTSKQMDWGKKNEESIVNKLLEDGVIQSFREVDFTLFRENSNGGSSPDGLVVKSSNEMGAEIKSTVSWDGHYNRMYEKVTEKHDDYWQFQSEMLSLEVNKLLYVVAAPMSSDIYDYQIVKANKMHQRCILHRINIADLAISYWDEMSYKDSLIKACTNYRKIISKRM